LLFFV